MSHSQNRRTAIKTIVKSSALLGASTILPSMISATPTISETTAFKGNVNHSVCRWTYNHLTVEALCTSVKKIGFSAIDLIGPKDWPVLKSFSIYSSMCNGAEISLTEGWNDTQYHDRLIKNYTEHIELVAKAGYKNLICFSGNRKGMDDTIGLKNCADGLKKIMAVAEAKGVTVQMELLNSKINHKDYMCDKSAWGIELCKAIGSPNFKLLYDIYHMQIDEGDIIRSIQDHHEYFGHYHTAGVPGRHEIDDSQELYYPAIMKAIVKTGFKGYVAQEFIPTGKTDDDKILALKKAVELCDV